ncbi:MAG TPA: hypothetical protein VEW64_01595 [Methyloceanibacter sp.]|jgi:hypothetical protein|nr:hypothetical protein [Methyloceanibacter sp.]
MVRFSGPLLVPASLLAALIVSVSLPPESIQPLMAENGPIEAYLFAFEEISEFGLPLMGLYGLGQYAGMYWLEGDHKGGEDAP